MFYVYMLRSKKDGAAYIGSTADLQKRLNQHNGGEVTSTRTRVPFELVYYEAYKAERDARLRESRLKLRSQAYAQLKKRLQESLASFGVRARVDRSGEGEARKMKNRIFSNGESVGAGPREEAQSAHLGKE